MLKTTFTILLLLLFLTSCFEKGKIVAPRVYTINGVVKDENGKNISTDIFLISDDTLNTKSDEDGSFLFKNITSGNYNLSITGENFFSIDTIISVPKNLRLEITLKKKIDYFPISVGNRWIYKFKYLPVGHDPWAYDSGKIKLTVIKSGIKNKEFIIEEIEEGTRYTANSNYDPVVFDFGPDTLNTKFEIVENYWIRIRLPFISSQVLIKAYYLNRSNDILYLKNYNSNHFYTDDQIKGSSEGYHDITLQKNVGIKFWNYRGGSNSAPSLVINLIDYKIE